MRTLKLAVLVLALTSPLPAAELESRVLTHYLPQDFLESAVRTEAWTELSLKVNGGLRKGDVVRVWAGGSIDRGNGDQPGQNVSGPAGPGTECAANAALAREAEYAFALLFKTEQPALHRAPAAGKPLELKIARDGEKVWLGFNDERGRYNDNHLGRGRRHEFYPLWVRIEVVRIIVD